MAKRRRRHYGWALQLKPQDPEVRRLSPEAREGLVFIWELGENALARSQAALVDDVLPEPLTIEKLAADHYGQSASSIRAQIRQARIELFGKDLSDSAIYYRLRKRREHPERTYRACAEAGCGTPLPANAPAGRRYCAEHGTSAARVRRHRRGKSSPGSGLAAND